MITMIPGAFPHQSHLFTPVSAKSSSLLTSAQSPSQECSRSPKLLNFAPQVLDLAPTDHHFNGIVDTSMLCAVCRLQAEYERQKVGCRVPHGFSTCCSRR